MSAEPLLSREDRLVAALSHASIVLYLVGPLVPLIAWLAERENSPYLRFQAAQALVFQLIGTVINFGLTIFGSLFYIGAMIPTMLLSGGGEPTDAGLAAMGLGILTMCLAMGVVLILWPLFVTLGLWGALQALRGRAYRYPLIGGWVERILARSEREDRPAAIEVSA